MTRDESNQRATQDCLESHKGQGSSLPIYAQRNSGVAHSTAEKAQGQKNPVIFTVTQIIREEAVLHRETSKDSRSQENQVLAQVCPDIA